jgi:P27 family predicted phage terminase small subunit
MPTPVKSLDNMTKHLTKAEIEARSGQEAILPSRTPKKPKLIIQDKAAGKHWSRILKAMEGLEIIDILDTDTLAIYCAKLARRDTLQAAYLKWRDLYDDDPENATLKIMIGLSSELQSIERDLLTYASKLGLTPESRVRLAKRLAEQEEYDPDADLFA